MTDSPRSEPRSDHEARSSYELLVAAQAGDKPALDELTHRLLPAVRKRVHADLSRGYYANNWRRRAAFSTGDIVQDVFLEVCASLPAIRSREDAGMLAYITSVVHNKIVSRLRQLRAARRDMRREAGQETAANAAPLSPDPTPSQAAMSSEALVAFREALESLTPHQAELVRLHYEHHLSHAELAEALGHASPDAARKAFNLARAHLVERMRRLGHRHTDDGAGNTAEGAA